MTLTKTQKDEFRDHRTSWKWFDRIFETKHSIGFQAGVKEAFIGKVLIEILKELQHLNDKTK